MRLGELMVQIGVITNDQLLTALRKQQTEGGRLGTQLVGLKYIDEETLTKMLASQLDLPIATQAVLDRITPQVVALLAPEPASRYCAIPVRLEGRRLWVALPDPTDKDVLAELSSLTGYEVRAMVAPESALMRAVTKHYSARRRKSQLDITNEGSDLQILSAADAFTPAPHPLPSVQASVARSGSAPLPVGGAPAHAAPQAPPPHVAGERSLADLGAHLAACATQRELFETVLGFVGRDFARVVLLVLRGGQIVGWRAHGELVDEGALRSFGTRQNAIPVIVRSLDDGTPRLGRGAPGTFGPLADVIGPPGERAVLVLPITCDSQPVGCVVGADGREGIEGWRDAYAAVTEKVDYALQIYALRKRLLE